MHRTCVRPAPASGVITPTPCAHPFLRHANLSHGSAWKAWAQVSSAAGSGVSALNSTWVVPGEPQNPSSQTLFFWNGMEPADTSAVLQPVLQWGQSAAGGGGFWAVASWYVSASHGSHFSPLVRAAPGDVVTGTNVLLPDGATWAISASVPSAPASTLTFAPAEASWPTAYHVLEAYGVDSDCSLYPAAGAVNFTVTGLAFGGNAAPSPIAWKFLTQTAGCGEAASASNGGKQVEISFHTQ